MHVHLITVKVSVVGSSNRQIHTEGAVGENFHPMAHDRHLVQRRLTIKHHIITVLKMTLNNIADFKVHIRPVPQHREVNLAVVESDNILSAWPLAGSITHEQT